MTYEEIMVSIYYKYIFLTKVYTGILYINCQHPESLSSLLEGGKHEEPIRLAHHNL